MEPIMACETQVQPVEHPAFDEFVATIATLRSPQGCPWDKEQTHLSIAPNMIEEAYEAVDAIEQNDIAHLREELGDVLLQVVLQSQIAADDGEFTIDDVCRDVNAKMIRRHPHVFGDSIAGNANEVLQVWDQIKLKEKEAAEQGATGNEAADGSAAAASLLDSVPGNLPALIQAQKISRKAASAGFEWDTIADIWDKVREEVHELEEAYATAPKDSGGKILHDTPEAEDVELEFGDVLFALVNVARRMGVNSENALRKTCRKFRQRWASMEEAATTEGAKLEDLSQPAQEALWQQAKSLR